jgi:catechol 2,3-dioxygenase-like lactoylglutathione lyase family enzyme
MSTGASTSTSTEVPEVGTIDMKLEVVTLPVSDVDRAESFYQSLGWRLDADLIFGNDVRVVQLTPPRSECSVSFGKGLTTAEPGSAERWELVVSDIGAAREISSAAASRSASCSTATAGSFCRARTRNVAPT